MVNQRQQAGMLCRQSTIKCNNKMTLDKLINLNFSEQEIKEGILRILDGKRNNLMYSDPKYTELSQLIEHIENNHTYLEANKDGSFSLVVDGVVSQENIDLFSL